MILVGGRLGIFSFSSFFFLGAVASLPVVGRDLLFVSDLAFVGSVCTTQIGH